MASITIRKLDDTFKARLRVRAAKNGRSMEDEARDILRNSLNREKPTPVNIAATIRARVKAFGGINLPPTAREPMRQPIDFARRL